MTNAGTSSALYSGIVIHRRFGATSHALRYRMMMALLDLDDLAALDGSLRLFSHNRRNLFSFHDRDYLPKEAAGLTLRGMVEDQLATAGIAVYGGAIRLLTLPRILGFAFNPLSVYFCHRADGSLAAMLYAVNNTFGQRHTYVIPVEPDHGATIVQHCEKVFHVSPFLDMDMVYEFRVVPPGERIAVAIDGSKGGARVIAASFAGSRRPLSDAALLRAFLGHPLLSFAVVAGIHWEALKLWLKGAGLRARPAPPEVPSRSHRVERVETKMSLVEKDLPPSSIAPRADRRGRGLDLQVRALSGILSHLACGRMTIVLPDGRKVEYGAPEPGPDATLVIHKWRTIWRTITRGDMGFAEAFIDGDCSSPDIAKVVELFVLNEAMLAKIGGWAPVQLFNKLFHMRRANTKRGSKRNIVAHYDLGNAFFEQWLDAGMTYSSALYAEDGQSLEEAQSVKQEKVLAELALAPGQSVLEVGFGWGGMAERILERGSTVTGLTLSPSQLAYAVRRLSSAGRSASSDLRLQDYRDVSGTFDRIVSIEMLEAVGRAYWPSYFGMIRDRLAKDGQAVLQVITLDETRYESYCDQVDFIQRYIFPGGMLPTPTIMRAQIAEAGLALRETFTFGQSYAKTLAEWSRRFQAALPHIEAMGFDERFQRLWTYYLAYCEGGFRAGILDVALYTITRAESAA